MSTFLTEGVPVSLSGALGSAGNYTLFNCDQPNLVLYVARQPRLVLDDRGKPGVAVTTYTTQQPDGSIKIASGAATIAVNTTPSMDAATIDQAKALVAAQGVADPALVRFHPLTTQKGKARLNLPTVAGAADQAHNERDVGTPGGSLSFLANLTEVGALEWAQGIRTGSGINGDITISYEYLRRMPDIGAEVRVHGRRMFEHLSAALDVSYNGFFYGGSAKLEAAWDEMTRTGAVEVVFFNQGLPPDLEALRQEMVKTFSQQAQKILFEQIFAPMPQVAPAHAEHGGGFFGGANFALKWQQQSDSIDFTQRIEFRGTTWLNQSMDISLAALFSGLDPACLTNVPAQQAFDSVVLVDADEQLESASVSLSYSEGSIPRAPVFGKEGGTERYTVVSTRPTDVVVNCVTQLNFTTPRWPIVKDVQKRTVGEGGDQMVIKASASVGRTEIYLFVTENDRIVLNPATPAEDFLVLNVSYEGPHLSAPLRDSARLDTATPVTFAYPLDLQGRQGVAKFSAFGQIGGRIRRAPETVIPPVDTAVFILADLTTGTVRLVTSETQLPEAGGVAAALVRGQARPVVVDLTPRRPDQETRPHRPKPLPARRPEGAKRPQPEKPRPEKERPAGPTPPGRPGEVVRGWTIGVEYGRDGTSLWVRLADGSSRQVRLRPSDDWSAFEKESRDVEVRLDASGEYVETIRTTLTV
ncbi:hypothetical protein SAMN05216188_106302 [Lentzea xinjiangensis]|uniref:Uncharacterized protein n=1 Tax=Lentzea xinjiangensis TaxID=402600 RepID=A0A1H9K523_9PSEU|nr:hypothetical protein [Lentzea xinjiangensis]SEQ94281.1 hypothetical protein SAMN05216188_106302 [Lentzea xinjiangensis]